jgi:hypothetical protein
MPRDSLDPIGKKMRHLGTIEAGMEKAAIEDAVKEFRIEPALSNKIAVTKRS